jgi:ribosomal protein S27AE
MGQDRRDNEANFDTVPVRRKDRRTRANNAAFIATPRRPDHGADMQRMRPRDHGAHDETPEVRDRLEAIDRQLVCVERELRTIRDGPLPGTEGIAQVDVPWPCGKCGYMLGYFDSEQDQLRMRHRGQIIYVATPGDGKINAICPRCSAPNSYMG